MSLYGITDLAKRWQYTRQGVHNKMKEDKEFPEPIAIVNQRTLVFDEQDVINYEKKRKELTDINHKHYLANGRFKYFLRVCPNDCVNSHKLDPG